MNGLELNLARCVIRLFGNLLKDGNLMEDFPSVGVVAPILQSF